MTRSTTADTDNRAGADTSPAAASTTATESADRERSASHASHPETVLLTALLALVAAVALFGVAFPGLLAPAVAIAVLAAIVALDWLLPSGELRQVSARFGKR